MHPNSHLPRHTATPRTWRRSRRTRIALAIAGVVSLVFVLGAAIAFGIRVGRDLQSCSSSSQPPQAVQPAAPSPAVSPPPQSTTPTSLADDFKQLQDRLQARVGVAVAPAGDGSSPLLLGDWQSGPAWSTRRSRRS